MFPLKDDNPTRRFPILTVALIMINALVFLFEMSSPPVQAEVLVRVLGVVPARFLHGPVGWSVLTLFTSQFLHGGILHLAGNMLYLWIFGNNIEDYFGRSAFLLFYLAGGAVAGLGQILAHAASTVPTIGASGAIAAVLGAYLVLYPRAKVYTLVVLFIFIRVLPLPAALWLGIWFVIQVASAMASAGQEFGVAWVAHAAGFLFGVLVAVIVAPRQRERHLGNQFGGTPLPW